MPNRLGSAAKKERKADEKVRNAEEKFKELQASRQRKIEKKIRRLVEKKSAVSCQLDDAPEIVLSTADETQGPSSTLISSPRFAVPSGRSR